MGRQSDEPCDRHGKRLRRDAQLRLELDYCAPRGIPHSFFLGDKRPEWSQDDRDKALAWFLRERSKCSSCGTIPEEWLTKDGEREAIPPPFEPQTFTCHGCAQRDKFEKAVTENGKQQLGHGKSIVLVQPDPSTFRRADFTDRMIED